MSLVQPTNSESNVVVFAFWPAGSIWSLYSGSSTISFSDT